MQNSGTAKDNGANAPPIMYSLEVSSLFVVPHYFAHVYPFFGNSAEFGFQKVFAAQALSMNRQKGFSITAKLPSQLSSAQGEASDQGWYIKAPNF